MKPNYGIDAPPWIFGNAVLGAVLIAASIAAQFCFSFTSWLQSLLVGFLIFCSLYCFVIAALMFRSSKSGKRKLADEIFDGLKLKGDEKILDAGCGRGLFLIEAAKRLREGKAVGIDLWSGKDQSANCPENTLLNAKIENVADRVELLTGDLQKLVFDDQSFDLVISSLVLHNLSTREARRCALLEICRVLKPGGRLRILDFWRMEEHLETLQSLGWQVEISPRIHQMFPPVKIISTTKP